MDTDELKQLIAYIKESFSKNATDIAAALDLLTMSLDDLSESAREYINNLVKTKGYDNIQPVVDKLKLVSQWRERIVECSDFLVIDNDESDDFEEENDLSEEKRTIPDYSKYVVDDTIPHTLAEHYTYKRPAGFLLMGIRYDATDWKDVLLNTCNVLASKDASKFKEFLNDPTMKGRKNVYFSTNHVPKKNAKIDSVDIYVWINLSANNIRNNIRLILKKFDIPLSEFVVYLRADLTPLHQGEGMHAVSIPI